MGKNHLKILVVEDAPDVRQVLSLSFTKFGHEVVTCENGQDAVTMCIERACTFDVVLMDQQMPVMDGIAATRLLRADPRSRELLIIALSANLDKVRLLEDADQLFDAMIPKPFSPRELLKMVTGLAEARK